MGAGYVRTQGGTVQPQNSEHSLVIAKPTVSVIDGFPYKVRFLVVSFDDVRAALSYMRLPLKYAMQPRP